jgi:hypothetical protein
MFVLTSPEGTVEMNPKSFNRPYGTEVGLCRASLPSDESLGYCQTTLRVDEACSTFFVRQITFRE